jgi:AraC-like DNA-binding protein
MVINILFNLIANDHKVSMLLGYNILMIITGALIGYLGMKQENLYEHIKKLSSINSKGLHKPSNRINERSVKVAGEEKSDVLEALKKLMESKKLYLNSKLTIDDLADQLNVNKRIISIIVNDEMDTNIYGFINDYRIREFKKIISEPDMAYLSMEGIAEKVGFTSKSSFNSSFKKATGKTPSQYRQQSKINQV